MIIYSRTNSYRKQRFQIITTIEKKDGIMAIYKTATNKKSEEFLQLMIDKYNYLKDSNVPFQLAAPKYIDKSRLKLQYFNLDSLHYRLFEAMKRKDKKAFVKLFQKYIAILKKTAKLSSITVNHHLDNDFKSIFGDTVKSAMETLKIGCLDLNFDNIFIDKNNFVLIDYEWTFNFPIPYKFIIFRALTNFYASIACHNPNLFIPLDDLYNLVGIKQEERECFTQWEYNFQNYVSRDSESTVINLEQFKNDYNNLEKIADNIPSFVDKCNSIVVRSNEEKAALNKTLEERNKYIQKSEQDMAALNKTLEERNKYIQQNEQDIAALNKTLEERNKYIQQNEQDIARLNKTLEERNKYIQQNERDMATLNKTLEERNKYIQQNERDMARLSQAIEKAKKEVSGLNKVIEEKNQIIKIKDDVIENYNQALKRKDQKITNLNQTIESMENTIDSLRNSWSLRIGRIVTTPLGPIYKLFRKLNK